MTLRSLAFAAGLALGLVALPGCMQAQQMLDQAMQASESMNANWDDTAVAYRGRNNLRVAYICPPGGDAGSIWGSGVYTDDSSVCTAGVHAGRITFARGGRVTIEIRPGQNSYSASTANGVRTSDYPRWDGSYVVL